MMELFCETSFLLQDREYDFESHTEPPWRNSFYYKQILMYPCFNKNHKVK